MNTQDSDRILTEVPHTSILCLRHPLDGSLSTERCTLQMFPSDGRMYLAGVFTFAVDDEADLRLTIRHPRTHRPFVVDGAAMFDVQAISLNPDVRSKKYSQFRCREFFVPISGTRNEDGNREPAYCSKEQPLLIDVEGDTVLHLVVLGADHYTVTRLPYPFSHPESLGKFRGPYCDLRGHENIPDAVDAWVQDPRGHENIADAVDAWVQDPRGHENIADAVDAWMQDTRSRKGNLPMITFRENWLEPVAGLYIRFRPVPDGEQAPILAVVRRDGDGWVPRVMPDHAPICGPSSLLQCMEAVEKRLSELYLVRAVRDLCADEVSGCLYRDEDAPDAGDDVRSLDPADLLDRIRARR